MSEDTSKAEESAEPTSRDASLRVDSSSLHGDELDFAKMMGFGDEPAEEPTPDPEPASSLASQPEPEPEPEPEPDATDESETEAAADSSEESAVNADQTDEEPPVNEEAPEPPEGIEPAPSEEGDGAEPLAAADDQPADRTDWEEIHPRPSADGNQGLLQARAREVMNLADAGTPTEAGDGDIEEPAHQAIAASPAPVPSPAQEDPPREFIAASDSSEPADADGVDRAEFVALEKEREAISAEFEALNTEHELLLDDHSSLQGQLIRSNEEVERLQVSLRAMRVAHAPLPEGERALRAEVLGLRDRLEVARAENHRLDTLCENAATDLSITQARFEDRQHEVDVRLDEIAELRRALEEASQTALVHTEKQRELLDLSTRLQSENNELRSAQSALEETLQARNLEITAREEHLAVTRDGLLSRDRQIIDLNALLESTRAEVERAHTELSRRDVQAEQNRRALERREVRIAALSETLAKIQTVMGRRTEPLSARPERPENPPAQALPLASYAEVLESQEDEAPQESEGAGAERALLTPWRNGCLSDWMGEVGAETLADAFAAHLAAAFPEGWPELLRLKSFGGDQLNAEIRLLEALENRGVSSVEMKVYDPDARRAGKRAEKAAAAGWAEQIEVQVGCLSNAEIEPKVDAILLSDALFGQEEAARELEWCEEALSDTGLLLFVDQLEGGALTLSEDTLSRLEEIWSVLPESLTLLPGFAEMPEPGEDGGVPESAGPALATLLSGFVSRADVGFGHLADLVVGPARGTSLSEEDPATKRLLYSIFGLDESRSITESLPSRHGVGVFAKNDGSQAQERTLFAPEWATPDSDHE